LGGAWGAVTYGRVGYEGTHSTCTNSTRRHKPTSSVQRPHFAATGRVVVLEVGTRPNPYLQQINPPAAAAGNAGKQLLLARVEQLVVAHATALHDLCKHAVPPPPAASELLLPRLAAAAARS